jgi:WD40 repeat protein
MRRFRFRIGTFLTLIIVLSVGFAALRESDDTWDSEIFTLTLGALLVSILLAIHRSEKKRAFWLGFALLGAAYLGLSLVPSIESRLITTKALAFLESRISDRPIVISGRVWDTWSRNLGQNNQSINSTSIAFSPQGNLVASGNQGVIRVWDVSGGNPLGTWSGTAENFVRIGHSLFALIIALVGGRLSDYLYAKNRQPVQGPANPLESTSNGSGD